MKSAELFDKIGGDKLRAVITDFYERIFGDVMIGFMFQGKDRTHLVDREWEHLPAAHPQGGTYPARSGHGSRHLPPTRRAAP